MMVIDASVAFKWLVREHDSDAAIAWIAAGVPLCAPMLVIAETGNAMTKRIRRGELDNGGADAQFARLAGLLTLVDDAPFAARAFDLSIELRHAFYDCVYLAVSEGLGEPLLTADASFAGKLADHALGRQVTLLGQSTAG